ncbi:hypothetical protein PILCRDRAFT_821351 [Piloderma croceum F 1598]|uniref:Uncharacterized protein n=1 Tax=Piloderma croceum (strain F 1598) TaxID=765440 RepID=A0A0C3FP45_PILCF|nr:hypothetical protein PILCRDRAFT_821351 [Piloderma croceum F 1598]
MWPWIFPQRRQKLDNELGMFISAAAAASAGEGIRIVDTRNEQQAMRSDSTSSQS